MDDESAPTVLDGLLEELKTYRALTGSLRKLKELQRMQAEREGGEYLRGAANGLAIAHYLFRPGEKVDYLPAVRTRIEKYKHHGREVFVRSDLKGRHAEFCLCERCEKFIPGTENHCKVAEQICKTCVEHNLITPVWECPEFEEAFEK